MGGISKLRTINKRKFTKHFGMGVAFLNRSRNAPGGQWGIQKTTREPPVWKPTGVLSGVILASVLSLSWLLGHSQTGSQRICTCFLTPKSRHKCKPKQHLQPHAQPSKLNVDGSNPFARFFVSPRMRSHCTAYPLILQVVTATCGLRFYIRVFARHCSRR